MPRRIEIMAAPSQVAPLVEHVHDMSGVAGWRVQSSQQSQPSGDLVVVEGTNTSMLQLLRCCDANRIGSGSGSSISTSEPYSLVSQSASQQLRNETDESSWQEMASMLRKASTGMNGELSIITAGVIATRARPPTRCTWRSQASCSRQRSSPS